MKKVFIISLCGVAFVCQVIIAMVISFIWMEDTISKSPSKSITDSISSGKFIAEMAVVPDDLSIDGKKYNIDASWVEYSYIPVVKFPLSFKLKRSGYNYCFLFNSSIKNITFFIKETSIVVGDKQGFGQLRRSRTNKKVFYAKLSSFKPTGLGMVNINGKTQGNFEKNRIYIDYLNTSLDKAKDYSLSELIDKKWYAYKVQTDKGFNPFFLPFEYRCENGAPDEMQKLTFPVLLAMKFDFVDNNINMRHPAFIFLRDRETQKLTLDDIEMAVNKMQQWGLNIVVGGSIVQDGKLFSGTLKVLDKNGMLLEKQFGKSEYFTLMGKMVSSWITKNGHTISSGLHEELVRPMTSSKRALRILGQALTLEERSSEQWKLYEKILELDPDFAELRWWYANQKWWQTKDEKWESSMLLEALESHIVVNALREVKYSTLDDSAKRFRKILNKAKTIIPNHWVVKSEEHDQIWNTVNRAGAIEISKEAMNMPYAYFFALKAALKCQKFGDYPYSIPLMLSIINSDFNPGDGKHPEYGELVYSLQKLGYLRDATALTNPTFQYSKNRYTAALYAAYAQDEAMNFRLAAELYKYAMQDKNTSVGVINFLINAYFNAGMISEIEALMNDNRWDAVPEELKPVFEGRLHLKKGNTRKAENLIENAKAIIGRNAGYYSRFLENALVELYCTKGSPCRKTSIDYFWKYSPDKRWSSWYHPVDYLWMQAPRSRKTYKWYEQVYRSDTERLRDYTFVATHLFPNQQFWAQEYENLSSAKEPDEKVVADRFAHIKKSRLKPDLISGFRVEYICLRLILANPSKYRDDVISFYRRFTSAAKRSSISQLLHRRAFLSYLENIDTKGI